MYELLGNENVWLNIVVSEYNSQKTCGDIGISNNELQYKLFCGKENRKGMIPLSKIKFKYEKDIFLLKVL